MLENKLDKKWYGWIWCGIIFASLVRSLYPMITIFSDMAGAKAATITLNVIMELFFTGAVPAWLCYCCASIMFSMAWRRGYVFSSRTDFVYITMLFTAAARLVMGFIEIFSLFNAAIFIYSQIILDVAVLSTSLFLMYFLILKPKYMNDLVASKTFSLFASIYLVCQGVHTMLPCLGYYLMISNPEIAKHYNNIVGRYIGTLSANSNTIIACGVAMSIFAIFVIVTIVMHFVLEKKAKAFVPPVQPKANDNPFASGNPFEDDNPFEETSASKPNDNVFEEFDL